MIELVVFFYQVVSIVCQDRWVVICSSLFHYVGKVGQHLNQTFFFRTQFNTAWDDSRDAESGFCCLAQNRLDTCVCILDERTGVSVEVDRLFRVEGHVLAGIYFQDEIFQGTQTYDACDVVLLINK